MIGMLLGKKWNSTELEIRLAPSVSVFKTSIFSIIRPPAKSVLRIHNPIRLSTLTQIRVRLSKLNLHKFRQLFGHSKPNVPFK